MYKNMTCYAIIAAGGHGARFSESTATSLPKQFALINNKPVMAYSIELFQENPRIDSIVIVSNKNYTSLCTEIIEKYKSKKNIILADGGESRQGSVRLGLLKIIDCYKPDPLNTIAIVHDCARPLATQNLLNKAIEGAYEYKGALPAVPVKETLKIITEDGFVLNTPNRKDIYTAQTPQAFRLDLLLVAHKSALDDGFVGYDDASLIERLNEKVKIIDGTYSNIKITTSEDLLLADVIISKS